jgi:hypothetical protein
MVHVPTRFTQRAMRASARMYVITLGEHSCATKLTSILAAIQHIQWVTKFGSLNEQHQGYLCVVFQLWDFARTM